MRIAEEEQGRKPGRSRYRKLTIDGRTVSEHRHIVEQALGRALRPDEVVHHKNGDRYDNRLENLEVLSHQAHSEHHNQKHPRVKTCAACGAEFEPHPTKRASKKTCSPACRSVHMSRVSSFRKLTPEAEEQIRTRRINGEAARDLAAEFGVDPSRVRQIARRSDETGGGLK